MSNNERILKDMLHDLQSLASEHEYSFTDNPEIQSGKATLTKVLMENDVTHEQAYLPSEVRLEDGTIIHKFDNPGWSPVTVKIVNIELVTNKGDVTNG